MPKETGQPPRCSFNRNAMHSGHKSMHAQEGSPPAQRPMGQVKGLSPLTSCFAKCGRMQDRSNACPISSYLD